ncbi:MAG: aspartyl/glutamyl-tRNA amidotransferase subunit A, partial [Spirochaetota bacterium]|nr:aspartyl/glutamyl-tRNA amidotransferase subunit A [Spirochaetota bacterium]
MDITKLSAIELKTMLLAGKISSTELTREYIEKIKADENHEKPLNALIFLMKDLAFSMAEEADKKIKQGIKSPLLGIPVIIKDNINIKGIPTTCASKILDKYIASYDATVVNKLRESGAVLLAKSNMDEFAMGSSSEHSIIGPVRNYKDRNRIPGGSSGGSASAISAKWSPLALGSDTGGSIRQPASHCGVVGLKPTYGRVSRYGLVAYSSSLDQIGSFSNNVTDTALILQVISGHDSNDSTSSTNPVPDYLSGIDNKISGMKIGLAKEYFSDDLDPKIKEATKLAIDKLKSLGCKIIDISLPHTEYGIPVYYIIATAEASSNLSRFDGIRYGYRSNDNNL